MVFSKNIINGWLLVDKKSGQTSTFIVNKLKRIFKNIGKKKFGENFDIKIGHCGTLDPMANGLIIIALGEATKLISIVQSFLKIYEFSTKFGEETDTDDLWGNIIKRNNPSNDFLKFIDFSVILEKFQGWIDQFPPKFSAVKIDGERAYNLARSDKDFVINSRKVFIKNIKIIQFIEEKEIKEICINFCLNEILLDKKYFNGNIFKDIENFSSIYNHIYNKNFTKNSDYFLNTSHFEVECSSGTYVRSLCKQISSEINTFGHAIRIFRKSIGDFHINNSFDLDYLENIGDNIADLVLPTEFIIRNSCSINLNDDDTKKIKNGIKVFVNDKVSLDCEKVFCLNSNKIIAVCDIREGYLVPTRVLNL